MPDVNGSERCDSGSLTHAGFYLLADRTSELVERQLHGGEWPRRARHARNHRE
jgi:hypothetical protein